MTIPHWPAGIGTMSSGTITPLLPTAIEKVPTGDPNRPKACVQNGLNVFYPRAWCGRDLEHSEFRFTDAEHAERQYADVKGPGLRACPDCVREIRNAKKTEEETR